jgi:hypothetical protein
LFAVVPVNPKVPVVHPVVLAGGLEMNAEFSDGTSIVTVEVLP